MTYAYDDFSRRITETDALNQTWTFSYDANNNLATALDPLGQTTTYGWDYGHQLATVQDHTGNLYTYTRNPLGQVSEAQSPAVTYHYDYDSAHRHISQLDSRAGKTLNYSYSPGGLLNLMQDNDGNRTDYLYDANGRLTGLWAANDDYISFSYDPAGRLTDKLLTNGVHAQYRYNADNTLASLINKHNAATLSSHVYTYDALGNRDTQTETVNGSTLNYSYGYDALNRLSHAGRADNLEFNTYSKNQRNIHFDRL